MGARLVTEERVPIAENAFVRIRIWEIPEPVDPSTHYYKYSLAYVVNQQCVVRFDNERGKGDHMHVDNIEQNYAFISYDRLILDFWGEVDAWNNQP
jgi:hypothetical protein